MLLSHSDSRRDERGRGCRAELEPGLGDEQNPSAKAEGEEVQGWEVALWGGLAPACAWGWP